jgi:hypothetical protein
MAYRAKFRLGIAGKERIEEYETARDARDAVAEFMSQHGARGYAEYLGKSARKLDRSTVKFLPARRGQDGIHVGVHYQAPKTTGGMGQYDVNLLIDPSTGGLLSSAPWLHNRKGGSEVDQSPTKQREIALELRDMFLKLPAWDVLKNREPDWFTAVDPQGNLIRLPRSTRSK